MYVKRDNLRAASRTVGSSEVRRAQIQCDWVDEGPAGCEEMERTTVTWLQGCWGVQPGPAANHATRSRRRRGTLANRSQLLVPCRSPWTLHKKGQRTALRGCRPSRRTDLGPTQSFRWAQRILAQRGRGSREADGDEEWISPLAILLLLMEQCFAVCCVRCAFAIKKVVAVLRSGTRSSSSVSKHWIRKAVLAVKIAGHRRATVAFSPGKS